MHHQETLDEYGITKDHIMEARLLDERPSRPFPERTVLKLPAHEETRLSLHILGSGSKGNCVVVSGPRGAIMIDCGFSKKETLRRMALANVDPSSVCALIVTHEHSDHVNGVGVISRGLGIPVYTTAGTIYSRKALSSLSNVNLIRPGDTLSLAGIRVDTFLTNHDAAEPIGMRLSFDDDVMGYATDTGVLPGTALEMFQGARILALESNHDPRMLQTGPYPPDLKSRIASDRGHLSNTQSSEALELLLSNRLQCVVGMHLSLENNTPDLALSALEGVIQRNDHDAGIAVANQLRPLSIIEDAG